MPDGSDRTAARPGELLLILGGARSGKSTTAERLARDGGRVLFIATAEALDEAMQKRIAAHRRYRPEHWDTLEEPIHVTRAVRPLIDRYDTFVLDCLTLWVSNLLLQDEEASDTEGAVLETVGRLLDLIDAADGRWILVSNEVGQGIVPASPLGREYRDVLGRVNQLVASRADKAYLMVAGLALDLKSLADPSPGIC
ncbi:MAG: bifunctional adenosylcobinamide kinase/adenosylcobinamide-phosphate guanylyltransferase [bacterium]|nr:bifunctional adenosylcobinamide kinase/adenosylcobinamide-phosphate guanylyltransferase [bacterium]